MAIFRFVSPQKQVACSLAVRLSLIASLALCTAAQAQGQRVPTDKLNAFFGQFCNDCHAGGASEGGLELSKLAMDLNSPATFASWERLFDRIQSGEMPPDDSEQPSLAQRDQILKVLEPVLMQAHAATKGTVLRRLNREEYENTLNDMFGTNLDLSSMLPEDGKSHEFDNVGSALGVSMVHLQRYMDAAVKVYETAIADRTLPLPVKELVGSYKKTSEGERFIGKVWKELPDGAIVRFSGGGYPSGMMRGTEAHEPGKYRITIRGYAYQSEVPITFSVSGHTFERGAEQPIYGFWSFPPGKPNDVGTIEFETWVEDNYRVSIEPYGINDPDRYKRETIDGYQGPGLAILDVTVKGPLLDSFPSKGHRLVYDGIERNEIMPRNPADRKKPWYKPKFEVVADDPQATARQALKRVATTAFRRPVDEDEVDQYVALFNAEMTDGGTFDEALKTSVIAILCSPNFLYLKESPGKLNNYAFANRLAYFLTRTTPDAELLRTAGNGSLLRDVNVLKEETERLLKSPFFDRFLLDFTNNWLGLHDIDFTAPDQSLFPEYDTYLRYSMPLETQEFLRELIDANLPISNIVKSDFAMLNSRLAEHYGLPPVAGAELQKVTLQKESVRGGLLTQASILKVTANGTNSSPVTRGAWVMERILGSPPPPPPPGVGGVEPDIRGASTLRELLDKHRSLPACNACHTKIDPPGFALESFNPIGGYRERYRSLGEGDRVDTLVNGRNVRYRLGLDVDSSGELPGHGEFNNYQEFRELLLRNQERLAATFTEKLLTFATGRDLGFSDRPEIQRIVEESARQQYRIRDLMHLIVQSDLFQSK